MPSRPETLPPTGPPFGRKTPYREPSYREERRVDFLDRALRIGVPASLALHLLFLLFLASSRTASPSLPEPEAYEVTFLPPPPVREQPVKKQIVAPPDKTAEAPPAEASRLSDVDSSTPKEQIRRGLPDAGPAVAKEMRPEPPAPPAPPVKEPPRREQPAMPPREVSPKKIAKQTGPKPASRTEKPQPSTTLPVPALRTLSLDQDTLFDKFQEDGPAAKAAPAKLRAPDAGSRPFSRPAGSGARFVGTAGSSDYLPDLPDGDITLLNAKADQYAVFVRRVASQVFSQLRSTGWETLGARDILQIRDYVTVEAVLSPSGVLLGVKLAGSSGNDRFDRSLVEAARKGTRDPNPPAGARAEDGNIHFIFQSKSWVQGAVHGRTGTPFERRWLLLATGLG